MKLRALAIQIVHVCLAAAAFAQSAVDTRPAEKRDRAERKIEKEQKKIARASNVEFVGATSFKEKELLDQLKEQITSIEELGLTAARADDAAFFLELYYRKHGFAEVEVRYSILGGNRLRLEVHEGPRVTIGDVKFVGNETIPSDKLFEFFVGPTRERYSKAEKKLPYVEADIDEGVDLVRRLYVSEGFLNVIVQKPLVQPQNDNLVDLTAAIVEGPHYVFGDVSFSGNTVVAPEELREEMADILNQAYTERRLADIPRRLQAFYKERGHFNAKVDVVGNPEGARGGRVPVHVTLSPGPVYYFDGATVTGLKKIRPSVVTKRFDRLHGKRYNPDAVDERFREMMKTGLFNILQVRPEPIDDHTLHLQIQAEEAKLKEFGFSLGYGSYAGPIVGASFRHRNLFGYGRPLTTSAEYSGRGYKWEVLYEDPWLFDTDYALKVHLAALTFDYDGYSKFEVGGRLDLTRKISKQYEIGAVFSARHVEVTSADIPDEFLGPTSYEVTSIGFTQKLDLRKSPLVSPRGFAFATTFDYAPDALGSEIEFVRATASASYFLQFAPEKKSVEVNPTLHEDETSGFTKWFRSSMLAFGARAGIIDGLGGSEIPIDERFFNGGSNSVRSFAERDLGPHVGDDPIGGEFFTVFNVEYTFPIFGELRGALFVDAGNLLPHAEDAGFDDMRYGIGFGLRYNLPIGPLRLDYGVNPDPRDHEDFGAFHFSFGFAF